MLTSAIALSLSSTPPFDSPFPNDKTTFHPYHKHLSRSTDLRRSNVDRRRRLLQYWLASVLLHPELGGSKLVRMLLIMD